MVFVAKGPPSDGWRVCWRCSLIAVKEAAGFRLCHVRNPWGDFEWNGEWSDRSPLWRKFPEVAQACGRGAGLDDANDGLFWMPLEKVLEMFEGVTVCYLQKAALRSGFDPTFGGHANNVTLASPRGAQGGGALGGGAQPTAAPKQASSQVRRWSLRSSAGLLQHSIRLLSFPYICS